MEERKDEGSARSDNGGIEEGLKQRETRTRISNHMSEHKLSTRNSFEATRSTSFHVSLIRRNR